MHPNQGNGITAYDVPKRIASYEADMDIMHPNRHKMVEVAAEDWRSTRTGTVMTTTLQTTDEPSWREPTSGRGTVVAVEAPQTRPAVTATRDKATR